MQGKFASFSEQEHRARLAQARGLLKEQGIDHCISVAPESLYYYGGYDSWVSVNSPQTLIFSVDESDPTIVLRDTDVSLALESSWVKDVRSYRMMFDDIPGTFAAVAREKGLRGGKVAIEIQSYAIPHSLGLALARALAPAEIVDATVLLGMPRLIKSAAEMAYLRKAGTYAQAGLDAARQVLKLGISEITLAGEIEHAMRAAGSDYWSIPTELASGDRSAGGHGTARERIIERGDIVHLEFAGVAARYHAAAIHTMAAGEPSKRARSVYDVGRASLAAGIREIRPGAKVSDIEEASLGPVRAAGLEHAAVMRFGYGLGVAYPPIWLEPLQISRGSDQIMQTGMVFVLHAYLQLVDEQLGIIQGGTYALTENGVEMLIGGGDVELEVV
ncbi:Xaa-Pro peptidase family protein [Mesorhizobium sp. AR07]|uniref:M24 family metallopeptidase n=1 Tax=Mesorhizobium sp. AR07 TaxID=2865838 RepID=UPI00216074D3|nr:Xaa-Pro peptidase family protein [Mesorhizobium sp. AR07]UVK43993.1 Xaa-Pro peptidase family protein [Mesorhizobium sp. AR07]